MRHLGHHLDLLLLDEVYLLVEHFEVSLLLILYLAGPQETIFGVHFLLFDCLFRLVQIRLVLNIVTRDSLFEWGSRYVRI